MGVIAFDELTFAAAEERAAAYLASLPDKVEALRSLIASSGTDAAFLDGSQASLEPLWRWIVAWCDAGGPAQPAEYPDWYAPDPPELTEHRLTPATLHLVDLLGAYLAEVFRTAVPDLRWVVVPSRGRGRIEDAYLHQPVLRGSIIDTNPRHHAMVKAIRLTLRGEDRHPTALAEMVDARVSEPGIA